MQYKQYRSEQLSEIFGLSKESICKYLHSGIIPSVFDGYRYSVSDQQLYDLFDKNKRMLYLIQENKNKKAQNILNSYKEVRNYERIYHVYDIARLCGMSVSWARSLRDRRKIPGNYISETEFLGYLKTHDKYAYVLKQKTQSIPCYEMLRVQILDRLTKEGFKWIF